MTYNLFREHEGIDYLTPGEKAHVNAPFTEWEDVVKQSPPDGERRRTSERNAAAELSDARLRDEATARGNITFVPDPTRRRRPKGETDSDDPDEEWPPSPDTVKRWRPEMPELAELAPADHKSVVRLPPTPRSQQKSPSVKVAAITPKAQKSKRHPFLRPSEQKQKRAGKAKGRKRPHSYTKLRQALKRR